MEIGKVSGGRASGAGAVLGGSGTMGRGLVGRGGGCAAVGRCEERAIARREAAMGAHCTDVPHRPGQGLSAGVFECVNGSYTLITFERIATPTTTWLM